MTHITKDSALVQGAIRRMDQANLPLGGINSGAIASGKSVFNCQYGSLQLSFYAGKFTSPIRYDAMPPKHVFSRLVQELFKSLPKEEFTYRVAVMGRTHVTREHYLEIVLYETQEREAILAFKLEDHHFNVVQTNKHMQETSLSGMIVCYDNVASDIHQNEGTIILKIVAVGSLHDYKEESDLDLMLGKPLGHPNSGVYPIAPASDETDTWGYLIMGNLQSALYTLDNHVPGHYAIMRSGTH